MAKFRTQNSVIEVAPIDVGCRHFPYVTESDLEYCKGFGSELRRMSWLTWRNIARKHIGQASILYDGNGAPYIEGGGIHISVSHSASYAAVILSNARCAIDIESCGRDFGKVATRFISPEEAMLPESGADIFRGAVWCAKETLYKYAEHREINLIDDMRIVETRFGEGYMRGWLRNHINGTVSFHDIALTTFDHHILTYIG